MPRFRQVGQNFFSGGLAPPGPEIATALHKATKTERQEKKL